MPKRKVQGPVVPTSNNVDRLLRELMNSVPGYTNDEIQEADRAVDARTKAVLDKDAELKKLKARYEQLRKAHDEHRATAQARIRKVRQQYLSEGVTPRVVREVQALVELLNPTV